MCQSQYQETLDTFVDIKTLQPSVDIKSLQPSVDIKSSQSSVDIKSSQSSVDIKSLQPSVDIKSLQPSVDIKSLQSNVDIEMELTTTNCIEISDIIEQTIPPTSLNDNLNDRLESLASNSVLHKCNCKGVMNNKTCLNKEIVLTIVDHQDYNKYIWMNSSLFAEVQVFNLQCPNGYTIIDLNIYSFDILSNGHLMHYGSGLTFDASNYCIDVIREDSKSSIYLSAKVCLPPPVIVKCCTDNKIFDISSGKCIWDTNKNTTNDPLIQFDGEELKWQSIEQIVRVIQCENIKSQELFYINSLHYLSYEKDGISLYVSLYPSAFPIKVNNKNYCLSTKSNEDNVQYVANSCIEDPRLRQIQNCNNATCIRKCCSLGESYNASLDHCESSKPKYQWVPQFRDSSTFKKMQTPDNVTLETGFPYCKNNKFQLSKDDKFLLLGNGSLFFPTVNTVVSPEHFCLDSFIYESEVLLEGFRCFPENTPINTCEKVKMKINLILMIISIVFLTITLLFYCIVPNLHPRVHGKCLIAHVGSLLVAFISKITIELGTQHFTMTLCKLMGILTQVSFLAAFFWLNVMCFDIWLSIRWSNTSGNMMREGKESEKCKLRLYSIYALGVPIIISVITFVMDLQIESDSLVNVPGFGHNRCWFKDDEAVWVYFYMFVFVLTIVNSILFSHIAFIFYRMKIDSCGILNQSKERNRESLKYSVQLFVLMGVTWVWEVMTWVPNSCWVYSAILGDIPDFINALRGLWIFLIFICNKKFCAKLSAASKNYVSYLTKVFGWGNSTKFSVSDNNKIKTHPSMDTISSVSERRCASIIELTNRHQT